MLRRNTICWLIFLIISCLIVACTWPVISAAGYETGDFAANSLLMQAAKRFHLLVGNYSRIGFNHPGPAILYVLAAGEVLFHDLLHVVGSPIGGQLIVVALYSAFWIATVASLLGRLLRNGLEMLLFTGIFCFVLSFWDPRIFNGLWFPHLYVLPFAAFSAAVVLLILGEAASWLPAALACGFLINGHVSFVFVTGIMLVGAVATNAALFVFQPKMKKPIPLLFSRTTLASQKRPVVLALCLILAFLIPFAIKTFESFPGPAYDYLHYSGDHGTNSWGAAALYVSSYWAPSMVWSAALIVLITIAIGSLSRRLRYAAGATLALASLGAMLYAKFGIDDLNYTYIALFYYTCPAIAFGFGTIALYRILPRKLQMPTAVTTTLICAAFFGSQITKPADYSVYYNDPNIPDLFDHLYALADKPVVLDLDDYKIPGNTWLKMMGVQAYAARLKQSDFFCIRNSWQISNTKIAQCTDKQISERPRYVVTAASDPALAQITPVSTADGLAIVSMSSFACLGEEKLLLVSSHLLEYKYKFDAYGWTSPESDLMWSIDQNATLQICLKAGTSKLELDLGAYLSESHPSQTVSITIGNKVVANASFNLTMPRQLLTVELPPEASGHRVSINFGVEHLLSPKDAGQSDDEREFGVALYGMGAQ